MAIVVEGRLIGLVFLILAFILFYYFMTLSQKGARVTIRSIPAVEAIPEAIGRAAEMGTKCFYSTGVQSLSNPQHGPMELAGISMLGYVCRLAARAGVQLQFITAMADKIPLVEEQMRTAYMLEGKPDEFSADMITFSPGAWAWAATSLGFMQRERPASNFFMGGFNAMSVVVAEAGNTIGAMQVAGCPNIWQIAFFVATCDYVMIAEELYAASAAASEDQEVLGMLRGEDVFKVIILAFLSLGFILGFFNNSLILNILGM
jgi:hypothetical protein